MKRLTLSKNQFHSVKSDIMSKIILCIALFIFNYHAFSTESISVIENPDWNIVQKDSEIELYERWIELPAGRKTRERKGVFCVNNSVEEILELVTTSKGIKCWMSGVEESREISESMIYVLFNVPWPFKDKDLVAALTTSDIPGALGKTIHYSAAADYLPLQNGAERLKSYEAHWTITAMEPGRTQVTFTAYSDTPPVAPKWIQDPITAKLFKDNLIRLRDLLIELNYNNLNALNR